jgi:hypothetical protein
VAALIQVKPLSGGRSFPGQMSAFAILAEALRLVRQSHKKSIVTSVSLTCAPKEIRLSTGDRQPSRDLVANARNRA